MRSTILTPVETWARTAKVYTKPDRSGKASDYQLGTNFHFDVLEFDTLDQLAAMLRAWDKGILISGEPTLETVLAGVAPRKTKSFPYPDDQVVHVFDIDGWVIPQATRDLIQPNLQDPESMGRLINQLLRNEGFDLLAEADKLIVLTSSNWDLNLLNCHMRVVFDKPIRVEALREFSLALSKINGRKVFDDAIYKSVQPQFFTPPTCEGFIDPLKGNRIFMVHGTTPTVSLAEFEAHVTKVMKLGDWNPHSDKNKLPPIGNDWLHTIRNFVGAENGINDPSYRAAAQLVQSMGRSHVLAHINELAKQMFDEVWKTLEGSSRGQDAKDKSTYILSRFRQYLESACDKTFGNKVDELVSQVNEAIQAGLEGDTSKLMSTPVVYALKELKVKHLPQYLPLKIAITKKHKLIGAQDLSGLLKSAPDATDDADGNLIVSGGDWNENLLIDPVLKQYDYVTDFGGTKYASVPGNGDGGYHMMRLDDSMANTFYVDGMKLSGNNVGVFFGKKVLNMIIGTENRAEVSVFEKKMIATRVISEDQTPESPTWVNLGMQPDGKYQSARISADGVQLMSHQDSKPRWKHGTPPLVVATTEQLNERFADFTDMMLYIMNTLPRFICATEMDLMKTVMWICSTLADKHLSYIAEIIGPAGTGKSTAADLLKDLVDPSGMQLGTGADRTMFRSESKDFINDVERRHVTILDNISKLTAKEQDMLCQISTGAKFSERMLYTHTIMDRMVRRPLIVTALSHIITRPDLRSRVVTIEMNQAPYNPNMLKEWVEEKPYLLACFLKLASKTLKLYRDTIEKPQDIHQRDVFLACVNSAILGRKKADFQYVREFRQSEAMEKAYDSNFINTLIRYMDDKAGDEQVYKLTTRGLLNPLKQWALDNSGKEIDGVVIDVMSLPQIGQGLGWEIMKGINEIQKISNWNLSDTLHRANGKQYVFTRKNKLDTLRDLL